MYCGMQYEECCDSDVTVSAYLQLSDEAVKDGSRCWDYSFRFENNSNDNVILLSKRLSVVDAYGKTTSVDYIGFKGQEPQLVPGDDFEDDGYVTAKSNAVLKGICRIIVGNKIKDIELPAFSLIANDNLLN